jgi:hypothetical protein
MKRQAEASRHLTWAELTAGLDDIRRSPSDDGALEMIVRRPGPGARECLEEADLSTTDGLVGDRWRTECAPNAGAIETSNQITIMNSRVAALLAGDRSRWMLAGDQLYVDLDLGVANLAPGTLITLGSAVLEISEEPHTGCRKFADRFGREAVQFVNSPEGRALRLRGVNACVFQSGSVRVGDVAMKLSTD